MDLIAKMQARASCASSDKSVGVYYRLTYDELPAADAKRLPLEQVARSVAYEADPGRLCLLTFGVAYGCEAAAVTHRSSVASPQPTISIIRALAPLDEGAWRERFEEALAEFGGFADARIASRCGHRSAGPLLDCKGDYLYCLLPLPQVRSVEPLPLLQYFKEGVLKKLARTKCPGWNGEVPLC